MSINIDYYNKCHKCKYIQKSLYMELEFGEKLYNYWCDINRNMGQMKCNKFEEKEDEM